jgi:hypothetical protein
VAARWRGVGILLLCTLSCASINFTNRRINTPLEERLVAQAIVGESDLAQCLSVLGAPTSVTPSDDGERYILTWKWLEQSDWGFNLSLPLGDQNASFNWTDSASNPQYVRLFFDHDWTLMEKAEG